MSIIIYFAAGVLTGLIIALFAIYVAAKLQHAQVMEARMEGNKGKEELLNLIKEQNMLFNTYRYVDRSLNLTSIYLNIYRSSESTPPSQRRRRYV